MDYNLKLILSEYEELKGQFVLDVSNRLTRLVAIGESDLDYYYITYDGRKLLWNTCVGHLVRLNGYIQEKDYNEFERISDLNDYDKLISLGKLEGYTIDKYIQELKSEIILPYKLLTDITFIS